MADEIEGGFPALGASMREGAEKDMFDTRDKTIAELRSKIERLRAETARYRLDMEKLVENMMSKDAAYAALKEKLEEIERDAGFGEAVRLPTIARTAREALSTMQKEDKACQ